MSVRWGKPPHSGTEIWVQLCDVALGPMHINWILFFLHLSCRVWVARFRTILHERGDLASAAAGGVRAERVGDRVEQRPLQWTLGGNGFFEPAIPLAGPFVNSLLVGT